MPIPITSSISLPDQTVTDAVAIFGRRGSGKTTTGAVMVEGMIRAGKRVVVVDPTGVWWGLRVAADGVGKGLPIAIIGGLHGDVAIQPGNGEALGRMVAQGLSCIIDISTLKQRQWQQFLSGFFHTLYLENTSPLHLVLDEADAIVPQKASRGDSQELHDAVDTIIRRGRVKGLGATLITQRPAVISKNVLSQITLLVVMRLTAPQDLKAIEEWIRGNDTANRRAEVLESLSTLAVGEGWLWAPNLGLFSREQIRPRTTFDSSSTPEGEDASPVIRSFAEVDQALLRQLTVVPPVAAAPATPTPTGYQPVKATFHADPMNRVTGLETELATARARIADLERQLAVSVPYAHIRPLLEQATSSGEYARQLLAEMDVAGKKAGPLARPEPVVAVPAATAPAKARKPVRATTPTTTVQADGTNGKLPEPHRKILNAIGWWKRVGIDQPSRTQVGFVAGYRQSGTFANYVGAMRSAGLIQYPGAKQLDLTEAGNKLVSGPTEVPSEESLHDLIREQLSGPQTTLINVLLERRGRPISREDLASRCGYTLSGTFANYIGSIKGLELAIYPEPGLVAAAPFLFLDNPATD